MIIEEIKRKFGRELKAFREKKLRLSLTKLANKIDTDKTNLWFLEKGRRKRIDINMFFALLGLGFSIDKFIDYLKLEKFNRDLKESEDLKFRFGMFCGLNDEYIKENYIPDVLEPFK